MAFCAYKGKIAISLLHVSDSKRFKNLVAHELHHIGFSYWRAHDDRLQNNLKKAGYSVAVKHIGNLLMEGMANYYFTPLLVYLQPPIKAPIRSLQLYNDTACRINVFSFNPELIDKFVKLWN